MTPHEALDDPRSALSEAYAALRASIELSHKGGAPHTLSVTSTRQSEGKSTTAYRHRAQLRARSGATWCWSTAICANPRSTAWPMPRTDKGFSNLLAQASRSIDEVAATHRTSPNLSLIAAGPLPPNPAELLSGPRLGRTRRRSGPSASIPSSSTHRPSSASPIPSSSAPTPTTTLFVVEANGSHHGHAKAAVRRLIANRRRP